MNLHTFRFIYLITHLETHITYLISSCQLNMSSWLLQARNMLSLKFTHFDITFYELFLKWPVSTTQVPHSNSNQGFNLGKQNFNTFLK